MGALGVSLGTSLLQARDGMQFSRNEAPDCNAMNNSICKEKPNIVQKPAIAV